MTIRISQSKNFQNSEVLAYLSLGSGRTETGTDFPPSHPVWIARQACEHLPLPLGHILCHP